MKNRTCLKNALFHCRRTSKASGWAPKRPELPHEEPQTLPGRLQERSRASQDSSTTAPNGRKTAPGAAKTVQDGPKGPQSINAPPRRPQEIPRGPEHALRGSPEAPPRKEPSKPSENLAYLKKSFFPCRQAPEASRWPPKRPERPQEVPQRPPGRLQERSRASRTATRTLTCLSTPPQDGPGWIPDGPRGRPDGPTAP